MTIAGVYLSPEGVVLGADSTASAGSGEGFHFFDFNQKLFEIGQSSSLALLTWGLGGLPDVSYRTLIATFADGLGSRAPNSVADVCSLWTDHFWPIYSATPQFARFQALQAKAPHGQADSGAGTRSADEEREWQNLGAGLVVKLQ